MTAEDDKVSADLDDLLNGLDDETTKEDPDEGPASIDELLGDLGGLTGDDDDDEPAPAPAPAPKAARKPRAKSTPTPEVTESQPTPPVTEEQPDVESDEDREIRELRAAIAAPPKPASLTASDGTLRPDLTEKELEIVALRDELAKKQAREFEAAEPTYEQATGGDKILIHIVREGGFTAQGQVWYRGQEIEFARDGKAYSQTKDRNGRSWLDDDEETQEEKYGEVVFRHGPWKGKGYNDPEAAALAGRRRRAAPVI